MSLKIFLADLVHDWEKVSLWTFPLNVGYIAAYTDKMVAEDLEFRLFKRPQQMIDAIKREKPDVVGLSHYVWNANLNALVFDITRQEVPNALCVGGGPNFTSANANDEAARKFFSASSACDAYVVNQGERGFASLVERFLSLNGDRKRFVSDVLDGALINDLQGHNRIHIGSELDVIRDLDEIPSPYLNGSMDEFFDEPFVPILETNRSCPYRCTFCAWGIGTGKLARFSDQRVFDEIEYLGRNCKKSMNLFIADANFSILDRDRSIAENLRDCQKRYGYPSHVSAQWNKSRPDRVLRVARALGDIGEVGASMQSLNPQVLEAIKRRNLKLEDVVEMTKALQSEGAGASLFTELILGLPNETSETHLDSIRRMIDVGAEVFNYNLHLLPGTEMDSEESREKYFLRTGWRLHDNAFGVYENRAIFEGQEVVLETSSMPVDELRGFRFVHFLIQMMWGRKWYYDYLHLFYQAGIHPVDVILKISEAAKSSDGEIGRLYERFRADHDLENFPTMGALADYWEIPDNLERLRSGQYGKLNYQYTYEILLQHYEAFNALLLNVAKELAADHGLDEAEEFLALCDEVLSFGAETRIELTGQDDLVEVKRKSFHYDLLAWRQSGYKGRPAQLSSSDRYDYEFFLPEQQRTAIERQREQFSSEKKGFTLRKMSEEISADFFFYKVRPTNSKEFAE